MEEYVVLMIVNKKDGFVPLNRASKIVEDIGGVHKYSALLEVKDGNRKYTMNVMLDEEKKKKLSEWLDVCPDILQYEIKMIY